MWAVLKIRAVNSSGGIAATGNYPGKARTADELRKDLDVVYSLLPGSHRLNLHAIYLEADQKVERNAIEPRHFSAWKDWAKANNHGVDFNPTCFSHPKAADGFTLSHRDEGIRKFWVEHCIASRKIGEYFGKELGTPAVTNIWIPDGYKDQPGGSPNSPRTAAVNPSTRSSPKRSTRVTTSMRSNPNYLALALRVMWSVRWSFMLLMHSAARFC